MRCSLLALFAVLALLGALQAKGSPLDLLSRRLRSGGFDNSTFEPPTGWFTQHLDHLNPNDGRTFKQRYWISLEHYKIGGPLFAVFSGEGEASGAPANPANSFVAQLAKEHGAATATIEHRFYGESLPFKDLTSDNLRFLSAKQALADMAEFIPFARDRLRPKNGYGEPKVITFGGSYSGALSAWFRLKFPQHTCGSVSSSGVVNAILDFVEFDEQVRLSAGRYCADVLRMTTQQVEELILFSGSAVALKTKERFKASMLTNDGDFFYLMADMMAESVQYGFQDRLCRPLESAFNQHGNTSHLVDALVVFANTFWYKTLGQPIEYSTAHQSITNVTASMNYRQWWWQKCTELAYFQCAPKDFAIRSHYVNLTYHRKHCDAVFGANTWPDTEATNNYFGGNRPAATNVIYLQGSQDPWQRAGVRHSLGPLEPEREVRCSNCGHCCDDGGCPGGCNEPNNLSEVRGEIAAKVAEFLSGCSL